MAADETAPRGTLATVSAAVLAGGASQRMGSDKAHLDFAGEAAVVRIARLLGGLVREVWIVGGEPPPAAPARFVADGDGPQCALRGLVTALTVATSERVLVVATDLPFVTPDLLLALIAWPEADAVVPRTPDGVQPLCALFARDSVLDVAREHLARGDLKLSGVLDAVDTRYLDPDALARVDPDGLALTNVNTPEELAAARARLADPN